ncbi:group III truncated hemoglobin [Mucilaginibacter auburnensis]|uniref:Hemoglobin n=1 Tax=Mucilaginibacter auburnensis TaxID=1457233 RepID=A0A2H9VV36_9SPHI|nr:group III truncated hemoglobin [Mucilaginibacter auburnensis]PJJ84693.1 hemoglobin [Mucilaginibacter auburnensis]
MKQDISSLDDIKLLVNTFYGGVQEDKLIGPIFNNIIQDWTPHLEKMYTFWQTVLLGDHTYFGSPFPPHAKLPVQPEHFERWLFLWRSTVDMFFKGEKAEEAKWRGKAMAEMFMAKISYFRERQTKPLI